MSSFQYLRDEGKAGSGIFLPFENQFPVEGSDLRSEVLFCNICEALIDFPGKLHNHLSCRQFSVFAMREQFSNQELSAGQEGNKSKCFWTSFYCLCYLLVEDTERL